MRATRITERRSPGVARRELAAVAAVAACAIGGAGVTACSKAMPIPIPPPICQPDLAVHPGQATYYDGDGSGACSFEPVTGVAMVAAIGHAEYDDACGSCLEVTGPRGKAIVRVVDRCPGCDAGDLDLSRAAFERIASLDAGRVDVTWRTVGCDVAGPLSFRFKDRSNASWTGVQIRNHRYAITRLELRGADGEFRIVRRAAYNYFVDSDGFGPGPYDFRITDARGQRVEDRAIALSPGRDQAGTVQFMGCDPH